MPIFANCSTNIADIAPDQFCTGLGGCGSDGLLATAANLNGILKAIQESTTVAATGYDPITNVLTITYADASTFTIDFTPLIADSANAVPVGAIILWSGAAIPTGWALCDGAGSTPDLRDRFIVGSGGAYSIGDTGGDASHGHTVTIDDAQTGASITTTTNANIDAGSNVNPDPIVTATLDDPGHTHTGAADPATVLPPFYAMAYIMKL
jgi:microcystin-dependent protein